MAQPFPELGWKGEAEFDITPDCLGGIASDGWVSNLVGACKDGQRQERNGYFVRP